MCKWKRNYSKNNEENENKNTVEENKSQAKSSDEQWIDWNTDFN